MPCFDGRENERIVYESGVSPSDLAFAQERTKHLEAVLCAILNELERRDIAGSVVSEASRHGLINIHSFWRAHSSSDEARISSELHKYSKDEQRIMLKILKESE